nr:reverse transcriptase domain-containing protein [Tanacetum cinerariifolium]
MKEVHYHSWLSNPVMVKKHDDSWRMCVDLKDLNKACPKDGYPLPKIDWKVESLCEYPYKCFLDAYKGYHQIKMAEEDEEKAAFITNQGIFCYSKMPFGLKNARATYQRLVDKAFQKQIGQNLEVYVDDLGIKIRAEEEVIRNAEETFKTLRKINMRLNPKKCAFGMREGTFLGYRVDADGLRVSPDKVKAVIDLPSPKCLKDVQKLNEKLAKAFKEMKQSIAELPMLTAPKEKEELIIYLAAAKEAISAVLMTERDGKQVPIYFVSRALQGPKVSYTPMEKLVLALVSASKRLKRYFHAHIIVVIMDQPIKQLLSNPEVTGRLLKWRFELGEHDIQYWPRTSVKGKILADFIVERPKDGTPDTPMEDMEELPDPWILFTDESSCVDGSGPGLIIMNPKGMKFTYALRFRFNATNNEAEYEALIAEELREKAIDKKEKEFSLRKRRKQELYAASMHAGPRSVVAKALRLGYFWPTMHIDARNLIKQCKDCQVHRPVPKDPQEKLTLITSPCLFYKWGIDIAGPFPEGPDKVEEVSHVLWAHRTMIKSSNGETPFSLTYGTEAVILAEIGMPTLRTTEVDVNKNNEALGINLDLLEEQREQAAIQEARSKARIEGYYNSRVRSTSFRPGDLVYRNNEASHMEGEGKLRPKWEGPYEVT